MLLLPYVGNHRRARIGEPYARSTHPLHSGDFILRDLRDRTSGCLFENTLHVHEVRPRGQTESQQDVTVLPTTVPVPPAEEVDHLRSPHLVFCVSAVPFHADTFVWHRQLGLTQHDPAPE